METTNIKNTQVTKEEFEKFISQYPNKLETDISGITEPPTKTWNDYTSGLKWPESLVCLIKMYDGSEYHKGKKLEYYINIKYLSMKTTNLTKAEAEKLMQKGFQVYQKANTELHFHLDAGEIFSQNGYAESDFDELPNDGWSIYQPEAQEVKHTPLPWYVEKSDVATKNIMISEANISVGRIWDEANAALICKAVNHHEQLVKDAERLVKILNEYPVHQKYNVAKSEEILFEIKSIKESFETTLKKLEA